MSNTAGFFFKFPDVEIASFWSDTIFNKGSFLSIKHPRCVILFKSVQTLSNEKRTFSSVDKTTKHGRWQQGQMNQIRQLWLFNESISSKDWLANQHAIWKGYEREWEEVKVIVGSKDGNATMVMKCQQHIAPDFSFSLSWWRSTIRLTKSSLSTTAWIESRLITEFL